jgi:hypothetical protein
MNPSKSFLVKQVLDPSSQTTVQHSEEFDCLGYGNALLIVSVGAMAGSSTLDVVVNESDTEEGTPSAVTLGVFTQITQAATGASKVYVAELNLQNRKRWLQFDITPATGAVVFGAVLVLSRAKYLPITQDNAVEFLV